MGATPPLPGSGPGYDWSKLYWRDPKFGDQFSINIGGGSESSGSSIPIGFIVNYFINVFDFGSESLRVDPSARAALAHDDENRGWVREQAPVRLAQPAHQRHCDFTGTCGDL